MNRSELMGVLAEKSGMKKKDVMLVFDKALDLIVESLLKGEAVTISGFGTFLPRQRKSMKGRNPQTNETIEIVGRRTVLFKSGKELKNLLKQQPLQQ